MTLKEKLLSYLRTKETQNGFLLDTLIENATVAFQDYTGASAADNETIIFKMVVEDFNKYGSEGFTSVSLANAKTEGYSLDYSDALVKQIRKKKKARML